MAAMDSEAKLYEIAYLISPALSENEARDFHQEIKSKIQSLGGLIDHDGEIKKRRLSYAINKMREAYLAHARLLLSSDVVNKVKALLIHTSVLRSLLVHTERPLPPRPMRPHTIATPKDTREPVAAKPKSESVAASPANIEEIDKKLEEILGS